MTYSQLIAWENQSQTKEIYTAISYNVRGGDRINRAHSNIHIATEERESEACYSVTEHCRHLLKHELHLPDYYRLLVLHV